MTQATERIVALAAAGLALLLGSYLRFQLVGEEFPLNDGALFYLMTEELRASGYALPEFTSYNASAIPFAYPPLAFYAAGLVSDLARVPLMEVVRLMPAVLSTLTLVAFFVLSRSVLGSDMRAAIATLAFALLPRTFLWFVMGGGLTRAPGLLFALLTLHQIHRLYTRGGRRHVAYAAVLGAATVLTHPENAWFAAYGAAVFFVCHGRSRRSLLDSLLVAAGVLLLSSPWWTTILVRHGLSPFVSVAASGGYEAFFSWQPIRTFTFTDERYLTLLAVLGLLGVFVSLADRQWFLPLWLAAVLAINPRNGATSAMVPLAMLIAMAVHRLVIGGLLHSDAADAAGNTRAWRGTVLGLLLACLTAYGFWNASASTEGIRGLRVLSPEARQAMAWVEANTDPRSQFVVIDGGAPWFGLDVHSEWFPVLAGRTSVGTVQGYEWLPDREFHRRMARYAELVRCRDADAACIGKWPASGGLPFTHVFLAHQDCCERLRTSLKSTPGFNVVYDRPGFMVVQRR